MSEIKKELKEEDLSKVSGGGYDPGETFYTYCPYCYTKSQKHLVHVWASDLECLKCHEHHRYISCNQAADPDEWDLQCFYNEIGYVPTNPNQQ